MENARRFFQLRLSTFLWIALAFGLGLVARNIADGLHPLSIQGRLPASTSPIAAGEVLIVESQTDAELNRRVTVQADDVVTLSLLGDVSVKGMTVSALQKSLNQQYGRYYQAPAIQVYRAEFSQPLN